MGLASRENLHNEFSKEVVTQLSHSQAAVGGF